MNVKKCDRCGAVYPPYEGDKLPSTLWRGDLTIDTVYKMDLCKKCSKELDEFLKQDCKEAKKCK